MLNLLRKSKKKIKCESGVSPKCEVEMTEFNYDSKGQKICERCTNL